MMNNKEIIKSLTDKGYTFKEAVDLLREHNLTGKPVSVISEGAMYERPLMLSFLDVVEKREELLKDIYRFIHMVRLDFEMSRSYSIQDDRGCYMEQLLIDKNRANSYIQKMKEIEDKLKEKEVNKNE